MAAQTTLPATLSLPNPAASKRPETVAFNFQFLEPPGFVSRQAELTRGVAASLVAHAALFAAVALLPILASEVLPPPSVGLRAFFATPPEVAPAPPPPPPPAPALRRAVAAPVPAPQAAEPPQFVAPVIVPEVVMEPQNSLALLGIEGGVPGGVEGGVPGGVLGGVVGGLPAAPTPPPERRIVRIGGQLVPPRLLKRVAPEYPYLAVQARVAGEVVVEAQVDEGGRVTAVSVVSGHSLLSDAAVAAVRQWRYQPLLLNGVPTAFVLDVRLSFSLVNPS
jgi:protein TonB